MLGVARENSYLARSQGSAGKQHLVPWPGQDEGNVHRAFSLALRTGLFGRLLMK